MGDLSWRFDQRERDYLEEVLASGFGSGTSGSMNARLEKAFSKKMGRRFSITFNSGTTTLHAALWALGVRTGDEVLVTPLTVISCMNAILYCGAIPVFVDIDPDTFLMDPDDLQQKLSPASKAIMPVHLYGQVCDMTRIQAIAAKAGLPILEDCAQCFLGTHKGRIAGDFGEVSSWSFENSKHMTTGDGGIVTCDDESLGDRIRKLSCQGFRNATAVSGKIRVSKDLFQNPSYKRHDSFGFMYRLPEVAAALGLAQIEKLDAFVERREAMAWLHSEAIESASCDWLKPQRTPDSDRNAYYTFALRFEHPDVDWGAFRQTFIEFGGDGIYAAWALLYEEDSIPEIHALLKSWGLANRFNTDSGQCPQAERIQPQLMQFTTNQNSDEDRERQADALAKTIRYYS